MRRVILSAIAVLAAAPIASAATWQPPTVIAPASPAGAGFYFGLQDLGSVQVRQDARGDFAVAWTRADPPSQQSQSHVQLSVRLAGASWTPAEEVAPPGTRLEAMAIDGKGDVTVAFVSTSNPGHPTQAVVRTRSASGRWDAPHAVGGAAAAAVGSDVAFIGADDAGDTLVVFGDPAVQGSQSEFRPAGGAWQAPVVLDPQAPVESIGGFAFGMGGNGIATLMEFQNANPPQNVLARRFTVAGGWEAPLPILTSPAESLVLSRQTSLAVSASGDAHVRSRAARREPRLDEQGHARRRVDTSDHGRACRQAVLAALGRRRRPRRGDRDMLSRQHRGGERRAGLNALGHARGQRHLGAPGRRAGSALGRQRSDPRRDDR